MHKQILKEINYAPSENVFIRRQPPKASTFTNSSSPQNQATAAGQQDSKILCKRIDNSIHNVNIKTDLPINQKFVPLAFPVENFKKKPGQTSTASKNEAAEQENQKTHSMPHSRFHSRQQSMPQAMPQSMPVSHNTSGYNLGFNVHDMKPSEARGSNKEMKTQLLDEGNKASKGLMNKIMNKSVKGKEKSPSRVLKKAVSTEKQMKAKENLDASRVKKEMRKPPIPGSSSSKKNIKEMEPERIRNRRLEESQTKSGKGSKAVSPNRTEGSHKKERRKVKKREHVSKSEIPPELEQLIQKNAQEYMEELRAKKHLSELEKRMHDERKAALEEGNRMIREANLHRFNHIGGKPSQSQSKFAWGVDQRKFQASHSSHERHSSMGHQAGKHKLDDKERRKMLGLDQVDEDTLHELQRKARYEQELRQREASEEKLLPRKQLDTEERIRLQDYMIQKRMKIEQEQHVKEASTYENIERKRHNLEKLFRDIRHSRERDSKKLKSKKKLKKRRGQQGGERTTQGFYRDAENRRHDVTEEDVDDENYSALYNEYKRIIDTKTGSHTRQGSHLGGRDTNQREQEEAEEPRERRSNKKKTEESKYVQQKKDEITQKYLTLSNRYHKNLAHSIEALEESLNKSSKKGSPGKGRGERGSDKRRSPYEHDKHEAQEVIIEMETDNFSDNDYLKSERMMIRDKHGRERIDKEESERVYDSEGNLPEESAREIIEAAAIFIQKNYRGYRTRKLLTMYFDQMYPEMYGDESEDKVPHQKEQRREEEEEEEEEDEEEEEEEVEDEDEADFLDYEEKKSIMNLLKKQKDLIHGGSENRPGNEQSLTEEEELQYKREETKEEESQPRSHQKSRGSNVKKEEYSGNKDRGSHHSGPKGYVEHGESRETESVDDIMESGDYGGGDHEEYDEEEARRIQYELQRERGLPLAEEDDDGPGQVHVVRRTKSDGELLDQHRFAFDYDDMEDSDQISLHDDGENFIPGNYQEHLRIGYGGRGQGYPRGINMMEEMDNQEEGEKEYDEEEGHEYEEAEEGEELEEEEELPLESQEYDYEEEYSHNNAQNQDLEKVPTVASLSVGTKNVVESQVVLNANTSNEMIVAKVRTDSVFAGGQDNLMVSQELSLSEAQRPSGHGTELKSESRVGTQSSPPKLGENENQAQALKPIQASDAVTFNYSKSSITMENFLDDDRRSMLTQQMNLAESLERKELARSGSEDLREHLIHELKMLGHDKVGEKSDKKKYEEEKKEELAHSASKSKSSYTQSTETLAVPGKNDDVMMKKTIELTSHYQHELARLKEEQARKWNEVLNQLGKLQSQGDKELSHNARQFIEDLAKQSEINKKMLMENFEGMKSGVSEERSQMTEIDTLRKKHPHISIADSQDGAKVLTSDISQPSLKKGDVPSPSESKFQKKRKPFEFAKKPNLEIDVSNMNEENNEAAAAALNLELSQMRLALGSEQLVREQSARTMTHSLSTPTELELIDLHTPENGEGGASLFERNPFKEFTQKKFKELMNHESMQEVIRMREQALEMRHKTQMDSMKKMLETRKFSPRTFQSKAIELEKWITKERENIQKSKKDIEKGWTSTAESIKKTQRDLQFLQKVMGPGEGRPTSVSDVSLRQSFVDEENAGNGESSAHGVEGKSPLPSKNIKIIDKFELKDAPEAVKNEGEEEKHREGEHQESGEKGTEGNFHKYDLTNFAMKRYDLMDAFSPERQKKLMKQRDTTPQSFSQKSSSQIYTDKTGSPKRHEQEIVVTEGELDLEPGSMNAFDTPIDWQAEARTTPPIPSAVKSEHKALHQQLSIEEVPTIGKSKKARVSAIEVGGVDMGSSTTSLSPKTPLNLRNMFNEQLESLRSSQDLKLRLTEPKSPLKASTSKDDLDRSPTQHEKDRLREEELNLQKKTDLITEEVFKVLMDELGKELTRPGLSGMVEKVKGLENAPPYAGLQNLIENNHFFTQGAEKHPGFQANIPMPPAGLVVEVERVNLHNEVQNVYEEETVPHVALLKVESDEGVKQGLEIPAELKYRGHEHDFLPAETDEDQIQNTESQADLYRILGIRTDLRAVEVYLDILMAEVKDGYMDEFLRNINIPIGLSVPEKLSNMHAYDLAGSESSLEMSAGLQQAILSIQLYLKIEEKLMDENPNKNEVSIELEHIHNKMIFDCLNEILDSYRPYSLVGEPYPWKTTIKSTKPATITRQNVDKIIQKARKKVTDWAASVCGYFGERDEFIQDRTQSFAEDYLAQTREEKLSKMLAAEVHEMEDKWVAYEDEETEVQLEIADLIFDKLVTETAELIIQINNERRGVKALPKIPERKLKRKGSL